MTSDEFNALCDMARLRGLDVSVHGVGTSLGPYAVVVSYKVPGGESRMIEQRRALEHELRALTKPFLGAKA